MTNILAAIIITVSTNWVSTGTFTPTSGSPQYDVQAGNLQTNVTAILEWKGQRKEMILETVAGPKVGERRVEKPTPPPLIYKLPWDGLTVTNLTVPL